MIGRFLFLVIAFLPFSGHAQDENPAIDALSLLGNDNQVFLNWTMRAGNTCNGIRIFHSIDSLNFQNIGQINGICGSADESISYSFTDESPQLNQENFYFIEMGSLGNSKIAKITVYDFLNRNVIIQSGNEGNIQFVFDNPMQEEFQFQVWDMQGKLQVIESNVASKIALQTENLNPGLFGYRIFFPKAKRTLVGKFSVR
jgi:hypothetical protein